MEPRLEPGQQQRDPSLTRYYLNTSVYLEEFEEGEAPYVDAASAVEASYLADLMCAKHWNGFTRIEWTSAQGDLLRMPVTPSGAMEELSEIVKQREGTTATKHEK